MYSAPAVFYPVGRSRFQAWLLGLLSLTGALAGLLWRLQADPAVWQQGLFALILCSACLTAVQAWRASLCGSLHWDGRGWRLTLPNASSDGVLTTHLDLQWCLLICLHGEGRRRHWLWLENWRDPAAWTALRRAVFSTSNAHQAPQAGFEDHRARAKDER
jgi:hypothetical protein